MPGATKTAPVKLTIRAYQVGFGDCFLLTFQYPRNGKKVDNERHVLVDFGSTGMPDGIDHGDQMMKVANDIAHRCNRKLNIVVATHRHKDHISGFTTKTNGGGTGEIIAALRPDIVIQPWTENPALKDSALTNGAKKQQRNGHGLPLTNIQYLSALDDMNAVASTITTEVDHLHSGKFMKAMADDVAAEIGFLSEDNSLPNRLAVANLARMGENHYVNSGYKLDVSQILPGVKIHVLGPPNLEQHAEIQKQRSRDENEFWMLQGAARAFWKMQAASGELINNFTSGESRLFPDADIYQNFFPSHNRWFIRQLRSLRGQQLLGLVRILDRAMNNTSVILLFEFAGKKLLFPGDAQIENWEYALNDQATLELLKDVCVYKVGHHGSRNATPKSLWKGFARKRSDGKPDRLVTINSTMRGKHGHSENNTEVPRTTLVKEMRNLSNYRTTEEAAKRKELYVDIDVE